MAENETNSSTSTRRRQATPDSNSSKLHLEKITHLPDYRRRFNLATTRIITEFYRERIWTKVWCMRPVVVQGTFEIRNCSRVAISRESASRREYSELKRWQMPAMSNGYRYFIVYILLYTSTSAWYIIHPLTRTIRFSATAFLIHLLDFFTKTSWMT